MKTEWDYTTLADAYLKRPDYAADAVDELLKLAGVKAGMPVCDVGAGTAHLTLHLARHGLNVIAVEPNDAMRANGIKRTAEMPNVKWFEGTGEETKQESGAFALVTFGSSFNVTHRPSALKETYRLLKPRGWFACMWNHRRLEDPIQSEIESIISKHVADYSYGTRREDQTDVINESKLFGPVKTLEGTVYHTQTVDDCIEAWRSHGTLERQAGPKFHTVVDGIAAFLRGLNRASIEIPYTTRIWAAQRKD